MTIEIKWTGDLNSPDGEKLIDAFKQAYKMNHKLSDFVLNMRGMSGKKYRVLINTLIENTADVRYLEIGSYKGSTACAAIYGNDAKLSCIDTFIWSSSQELKDNIALASTKNVDFKLFEQDFRTIDYSNIGKYNIYMYDGPHDERDQFDGILIAQPALEDKFLLIVDDWNGSHVQNGTINAMKYLGLNVLASVEIFSPNEPITDEKSDWHFGYFIGYVEKSQ
jgi:hypothetical protein